MVVYTKGKRFLQVEGTEGGGDMFGGANYQIKTDSYPPVGLES